MSVFIKHGSARQIAFEAAGLTDLASAGAAVAELAWVKDTSLATRAIGQAPPTAEHAHEFGAMLARLHDHGHDRVFGQAPPDFDLDEHEWGTMGNELLSLVTSGERTWGEFYADDRILPYVKPARDNGAISQAGVNSIESLCEKLRDGVFDTGDRPSILHGDLWSGNVLWAPRGGVLIDPASHAGHRESDLAQLTVFGVPHWEEIVSGYESVHELADGWRERHGLHQLHILIIHASLFGGSYGAQTVSTASRYL